MIPALPESPSPTGFNKSLTSRSLWSDDIEYVELEKGEKGLGFSILDYKVGCHWRLKVNQARLLRNGNN